MRHFVSTFVFCLAVAALAPPAHALPSIVSAQVEGEPLSARGMSIVVLARDPDAAVNGVQVDFGTAEGGFGESACGIGRDREPAASGALRPGRQVRFEVPFRPSLTGPHDVSITVVSGACGDDPQSTTLRIPVAVAIPGLPAEPAPGVLPLPLPPLPLALASATCRDANLRPASGNLGRIRRATLCLLNRQRAARGLRPMRGNRRLKRAATRHSRDMLARHFFEHEGPNGPGLASRLKRAHFWPATAAENIGAGQGVLASPAWMVDAWMHSSGHRTNILTPAFRRAGVGIVAGLPQGGDGGTYTVDFGAR